ncbi:MAG: hypothetical protein HY305_01310 [Sphingobacteriales bacterium]|nr:hypothetical protein [Sphingobacteriales bacterium]
MNLREEILFEHSKAQCNKILAWVGDSQQRFDELFNLFLKDEYLVTQRAAWPLSYDIHNAIKRNTVRLLQSIFIPKKFQGEVMNICFNYVADPKEAVAVKAFSLTILGNLAKEYPEIVPEIKLLIEEQLPRQTAAFKSRAKKLLNKELK